MLVTGDPRVERVLRAHLAGSRLVIETGREHDPGGSPDAVVLEVPDTAGGAPTRIARYSSLRPRPAILALCSQGRLEEGIAALEEGADDFLVAPFDPEELRIRLERILERESLRARAERLRLPRPAPATPFLTGDSPQIREVRRQILLVAGGRATVLLTGETGTGKELAATAIHESSGRRAHRMIKVNCAALPDPLLESELFGHERGAFTGASQRRIGRFEEADRGTLFLDEIGDMHPRTQAKVLRVLQEQEFERLGGTRPIRVDVRVVAATNQDLHELMAAGRFREDLFFRLDVVSIRLPPLRERVGDLPALAAQFLAELNAESRRPARCLSPAAIGALRRYPWPGNVRELRNTLERAVLMSSGAEIGIEDLGLPSRKGPGAGRARGFELCLPRAGIDYRDVERAVILQALERSSWVQKDAARFLCMTRRRLNYRIQRLGITHPAWRRNRGGNPAEKRPDMC